MVQNWGEPEWSALSYQSPDLKTGNDFLNADRRWLIAISYWLRTGRPRLRPCRIGNCGIRVKKSK